uniref:Uncharacterized protein n=1 Tax=Periophthalmus magnuspinnatus TaxID=409849 RepID=A0A3B4BBW0_9GOBI
DALPLTTNEKNTLKINFLHSLGSVLVQSLFNSAPCCCRRSPRLLTNGYYDVTQGSFTWDEHGNVSLATGKTSVCYKENLVRIFRRRRRPHSALVSLLHDVKDNCQSWLDQRVFGGIRTDESLWTRLNIFVCFFLDPTEAPPPPNKQPMIQEETHPDTCQSQDIFSQSVGGLSEVPPSLFSQRCCCQMSEQKTGKNSLLVWFVFTLNLTVFNCIYPRFNYERLPPLHLHTLHHGGSVLTVIT